TLSSSLLPGEWKNNKINFIDTPGSEEMIGELENVLSVVEGAIVLIDATKGVEVGTERVWEELRKRQIPIIIVMNKLDKENIKYDQAIDSVKSKLSSKAFEFTIPYGTDVHFTGFADVVLKKGFQATDHNSVEGAIPSALVSKVEEQYDILMEKVAETSEELLEKYFSGEPLTAEEIRFGLHQGVLAGDIFPIVAASGIKNIGVSSLLDMIIDYLPAPDALPAKLGFDPKSKEEVKREISVNAPLSGMVFKTIIDPFVGTVTLFKVSSGVIRSGQEVYIGEIDTTVKISQLFVMRGKNQINVDAVWAGDIGAVSKVTEFLNGVTFSDKKEPIVYPKVEHSSPTIYVAIVPKNKQDEDKISTSLQRLRLEDDTFEIKRNPETSQLLIGGQGMTHIGYILERMKNMFKVDVDITDQKVVYRETIRSKGEAQGRHKKQSGGAGQFGDVWIRFEPCKEDFIFAEEVVGGSVPKNFFPAVEKGLMETLEHGPLAGFPVIGVKATLYYGSYHPVDSNEISFKLAAGLAFKNAVEKIRPTILEPICQVNVVVKDEFVGDIMGDMTKRRGRVLGMEQRNGVQEIIAEVPEAEITKYTVDLKAMTQASGRFSRKFLRYEEVPEMLVKKIIEEYKKN
nr:elongation factor G [Bacilli bacterium]